MINHEHKFIFVHIGKAKANTNTILNTMMMKQSKSLRKNTQRKLSISGINLESEYEFDLKNLLYQS